MGTPGSPDRDFHHHHHGGEPGRRHQVQTLGETRSSSGALPAQKFTGQRLDDVGLYYYGARYYDPSLARFISADSVVPGSPTGNSVVPALMVDLTTGIISGARMAPFSPQGLNRYSYVLNNPLRYTDPTGRQEEEEEDDDETVPPDWGSLGSATDTSSATQQANTPTDISTPAAPKEEAPPSGLTKTNDKVVVENVPGGAHSRPVPPECIVGHHGKPAFTSAPINWGTEAEIKGAAGLAVGTAAVVIGLAFFPEGLVMAGPGAVLIDSSLKTIEGEKVVGTAPSPLVPGFLGNLGGFVGGVAKGVLPSIPGRVADFVKAAAPRVIDALRNYDPYIGP